MAIIKTYFNQAQNGVHYGCVQIENSKGERLKFEVCAKDRHDAEIMLLSTILEIKNDLMDAYAMFETTSTIKRVSIHDHLKRKKFKMRRDADKEEQKKQIFEKITRLMILRKGKTECDHVCDIDYFLPNLRIGGELLVNGLCYTKVGTFYDTVDPENKFVMQTVILKEI